MFYRYFTLDQVRKSVYETYEHINRRLDRIERLEPHTLVNQAKKFTQKYDSKWLINLQKDVLNVDKATSSRLIKGVRHQTAYAICDLIFYCNPSYKQGYFR